MVERKFQRRRVLRLLVSPLLKKERKNRLIQNSSTSNSLYADQGSLNNFDALSSLLKLSRVVKDAYFGRLRCRKDRNVFNYRRDIFIITSSESTKKRASANGFPDFPRVADFRARLVTRPIITRPVGYQSGKHSGTRYLPGIREADLFYSIYMTAARIMLPIFLTIFI